MNTPLVSIVIPVYKVEEWISKCLDSCIHQTYDNLEILAVNDGSPDNCKGIIEEYQKKDKRVILIDKFNGGLNSAREAGIKNAAGDYITIVDGDDFLELNAVELLLSYTKRNDPDIIIGRGRYVRSGSNETVEGVMGGKPGFLLGNDFIKYILASGPFSICMKLYRSSILKEETKYPNIIANQDLPLTIQWSIRSQRAVFISEIIYNYTVSRPGAVTSGNRKKRIEGSFESLYFTFDWISQNNRTEGIKEELINFLCFRLYLYFYGHNNFKENKKKIIRLVDFIHENRKDITGRQFKFMIQLLRINITIAHWFVHSMQKIKPTFNPGFKPYY